MLFVTNEFRWTPGIWDCAVMSECNRKQLCQQWENGLKRSNTKQENQAVTVPKVWSNGSLRLESSPKRKVIYCKWSHSANDISEEGAQAFCTLDTHTWSHTQQSFRMTVKATVTVKGRLDGRLVGDTQNWVATIQREAVGEEARLMLQLLSPC